MADAPPAAEPTPTKAKKEKKPFQRPPKKKPAARSSISTVCLGVGCVLALIASILAGLAYRYVYPLKQRCPKKDDRFYDHCMEGVCRSTR